MPKWFHPAAIVCALMFATTPIVIANAPFESTMGLVFKIFFYHMPSAWMFLLGGILCGVASLRYLITGKCSTTGPRSRRRSSPCCSGC